MIKFRHENIFHACGLIFSLVLFPGFINAAEDSSKAGDISRGAQQWALGLNYLIAPQAIAKMGYEFNDGLEGEPTDEDRLLIQLSYGF